MKCEEKNIRRRVYDALNVLIAMKIMHKEGKSIRWTGMPATMQEQCRKLEVLSPFHSTMALYKSIYLLTYLLSLYYIHT